MKYIEEFRNKNLVDKLAAKIAEIHPSREINIMEVCGTHTQSFHRFGLRMLLPSNINLIAGPGCPVCVSHQGYVDTAVELAKDKNIIISTFGDMLRIPGTKSNLEAERAKSGNVRVVYSPLDTLRLASLNPDKKIVFLAVGFETTAPTIALSIISAKKAKLENLFFLCSLKLIPPAMEFLAKDARLNLDGFLCPGHVSAVIGAKVYEPIANKYGIGCCVAGFEPLDILEGIYFLLRQIVDNNAEVENQYSRVVKRDGNRKAQRIMNEVFEVSNADWRGLGIIPQSGLKIRNEFSRFDIEEAVPIGCKPQASGYRQSKCRCGDILKGLIRPNECGLFKRVCTPSKPIGPCMVSSEGACNAYYKYR